LERVIRHRLEAKLGPVPQPQPKMKRTKAAKPKQRRPIAFAGKARPGRPVKRAPQRELAAA
jgi:hypothetical protein